MRLIQKELLIITRTSDQEIWHRTDQMKRVLSKNALDYTLFDFDDEDDAIALKNKSIEESSLLSLPHLVAINNNKQEIIGNLEEIILLSNNKILNSKCRQMGSMLPP